MTKLLQFVEFDAETCSLEYGVSPCAAGAENWFFQSSNEGFTVSEATLTSEATHSALTSTDTEPQLISPGSLTIDGSTDYKITLDIERVSAAGTWVGRCLYTTSGHGFSASFYKDIPDIPVGRQFLVLDMSDLTVGGDDWIENEITQIRFDFEGEASQTFNIYSIQVHKVQKCFNTLNTCQDRGNYDPEVTTFRYAEDTGYLVESGIEAIPSLISTAFTPAKLKLGESLGTRATLSVTFEDHLHADNGPGYDKYHKQREYEAYSQGTYWGRFRARRPFVRGKDIRLIRGELGQTLGQMDTRHYVVEAFDGPTPEMKYTLIAKDVLKFADDDRSQAPVLSPGFLVSGITDVATSATLSPSGVGNTDYPASGKVAIGGEEICSFTRSGDVLTLTRAQNNTVAVAHDAQDRVQLVLEYTGADVADIVQDLLETYSGVPSSYVPIVDWQTETAAFLGRVYTGIIAEPTGVRTLINELIEQAALVIWWDDEAQQIKLQVLRAISTEAASYDRDNVIEASLKSREEPSKRLSQAWVYYGQRNPLVPVDEEANYRSVLLTLDLEAESDYGSPAIKKIYSRWIAAFGSSAAGRLGDILISRFRDPPRTFRFDTWRYSGEALIALAGGYKLNGLNMQDATGAPEFADIQVTHINHNRAVLNVEAEEVLITEGDEVDLTNRTIIVDSNTTNFDLLTIHNGIYPAPTGTESPAVTLTCIVNSGVIVGSTSAATPAFIAGNGSDWPGTFSVVVDVRGRIQGKGGDGGDSFVDTGDHDGDDGGPALYTREDIDLILNVGSGEIWGGGGGGAAGLTATGGFTVFGGGGGGGQGSTPGAAGQAEPTLPGEDGTAGTTEAEGTGGLSNFSPALNGADGGSAGVAGGDVSGTGGAAGDAIDGVSFVTKTGVGDILGSEVN